MGCRCGSGLTLRSLDTPLKKAFVALNVIEMFLKVKEYFWLEYRQYKVFDSPSGMYAAKTQKINKPKCNSHYFTPWLHCIYPHISLFWVWVLQRWEERHNPKGMKLLCCLIYKSPAKAQVLFVIIFLPHLQMWIWCHWHQASYPSFSRMWATMMFTIKRRVESFKLLVSSYSLITVMPAGLDVRICSTA